MNRTARVLGVPMDLGADRRGVDMGPSAIRYAGLAAALESVSVPSIDGGDVAVPRPEGDDGDADTPQHQQFGGGPAKFLDATSGVCEDVATAVAGTLTDGHLPVVLGGDHTVAIGTVAGLARDHDVGLLWLDAHGDFNVPATSPSGNVHGMSLAAILGDGPFAGESWADTGVDPGDVALVGVRDLDPGERDRLADSPVSVYPISAVDERGITAVLAEAVETATGPDGLHVSLDMDVLDPDEAPGVGTPVRGGVTYREAHAAMELVHDQAGDALRGLEVVEVNPILDQRNRTADLAVELVASALGRHTL